MKPAEEGAVTPIDLGPLLPFACELGGRLGSVTFSRALAWATAGATGLQGEPHSQGSHEKGEVEDKDHRDSTCRKRASETGMSSGHEA